MKRNIRTLRVVMPHQILRCNDRSDFLAQLLTRVFTSPSLSKTAQLFLSSSSPFPSIPASSSLLTVQIQTALDFWAPFRVLHLAHFYSVLHLGLLQTFFKLGVVPLPQHPVWAVLWTWFIWTYLEDRDMINWNREDIELKLEDSGQKD